MKQLFLSLSFLLFMGHSPATWAEFMASPQQELAEGWNVTKGHQVVMPKPYSEESANISFCYAFSTATLINQMLLNQNGGDSYQPISMLDLAVYGSGMGIADVMQGKNIQPNPIYNDLGNEYRVLIYASLKGELASESCSPFPRLKILRSSNLQKYDDLMAFIQILVPAFKTVKAGHSIDSTQLAKQISAWEPHLKTTQEEIIATLKEAPMSSVDDIFGILGRIVVPQSCHDNAVTLPPFQVSMVKTDTITRAQFYSYLTSTINQERPLNWTFCIDDACKAQHSLVVTGWRTLCSQGKRECRTQYLLRDSGPVVSDHPGDFWVDTSAIDAKLDLMNKNYESLKAQDALPNRLLSLEY